jgi:hypothetical protein
MGSRAPGSLELGLPGVMRLVGEFEIVSEPGAAPKSVGTWER